MMGKDAMTPNAAARTAVAGNDATLDPDARKRRILRRGAVGSAASAASQTTISDSGTVQRVTRGRPLVTQGDPANSIVMIGSGRVRLVRALNEGHTLSLGYRGAGDLLGEAALGSVPNHRESAIATEDVEALVVPMATVRGLMGTDLGFANALLASLVERNAETEERLASMLFRNVEARRAEFIRKAAGRSGISDPRGVLIWAPFTPPEMASMIGSTRETVTHTPA